MLWFDLMASVRTDLGEPPTLSASKYGSALLISAVNDGLIELSRRLPITARETLTSVASQQEYVLPDNCLEVVSVEYPLGRMCSEGTSPVSGDETPVIGPSRFLYGNNVAVSVKTTYFLVGQSLLLYPIPAEADLSIVVTYHRMRELITGFNEEVDCPQDEIAILKLYMMSKCVQSKLLSSTNLDRWNDGKRDDSPFAPPHLVLMRQFEKACESKASHMASSFVELPVGGRRPYGGL